MLRSLVGSEMCIRDRLNCGKGPCDPATYFQHLVKEHPSALLLQCPVPGCASSFFEVHQFLYHLLRTHGPSHNPLAPFVSNRLRNCPYGGCSSDTGYTTRRASETGSTLAAHLAKNHQESLATCSCGPEQFDAIKLLHHLWDSYPEMPCTDEWSIFCRTSGISPAPSAKS